MVKVDELFHHEDKELVQKIYLSPKSSSDKIVWSLTTNEKYIVSSGYWLTRYTPDFQYQALPPPYGDPFLKERIWNFDIMPKLKHFLWLILSKAIGTDTRLNSRGMHLDPLCQRCGLELETISHLFHLY